MHENKYKEAETNFIEAINSFREKNHPLMFLALEALAVLHLKQAEMVKIPQNLKGQALEELKRALSIVHSYLPKNSVHLKRLQNLLYFAQPHTSRSHYE